MLPTTITDRHGNTVTYTYDTAAGADRRRLLGITASDGRSTALSYVGTSNRIRTVTTGSRTWTYVYDIANHLHEVVLPDNSKWTLGVQEPAHAVDAIRVQHTDVHPSSGWRQLHAGQLRGHDGVHRLDHTPFRCDRPLHGSGHAPWPCLHARTWRQLRALHARSTRHHGRLRARSGSVRRLVADHENDRGPRPCRAVDLDLRLFIAAAQRVGRCLRHRVRAHQDRHGH